MIDAEIEALYKSHGHYIYQRARAILGDDEEAYDALQEVFVKIIRKRPRETDDRPVLAWVNRVTTNHCLNRLRYRSYRRHATIDGRWDLADTTPLALMNRLAEDRLLLRRLVSQADERTQRVVVAYWFDEHGVDRIAADLSISVPTVRRVLKRFLVRARKKLKIIVTAAAGRPPSPAGE